MSTTTAVAVGRKIAATWGNAVKADLDAIGTIQSGTASVVVTASTSGSATVTFPAAYASAPVVMATIRSGSGTTIGATVRTNALSTTQVTFLLRLAASATETVTVDWLAVG